MSGSFKNIVIGSYLEPDLVEQIRKFDSGLVVKYAPELLPVPRYTCDHTGKSRDIASVDVAKWIELTKDADAFFDFDWYEPEGMLARSPNLKWIQATSAGIGSFMQRTKLDKTPITVTTAGGIHAIPLSEFAVMGALHFIKGVPLLNKWKSKHHWERYTTRQLSGLNLLIIGLGGIGRQIANSFSGLGVEVYGLGREGATYEISNVRHQISRAKLLETLPKIDIVVVCCPLTSETEGLLGARELGLLPPGAVVINISRGQVIDQKALVSVLREGRIAGACLDVFIEEPLKTHDEIWELANVIISPHSASTVATENQALVDLFCENLARLNKGEQPRNLFHKELGY